MRFLLEICIVFILFSIIGCEKHTHTNQKIKEIDSLLKLSDNYIDIDFYKSNSYANNAAKKSEDINDSYRKALSYYYQARNYSFLRKFDSCHTYIRKGFNEKATQSDEFLKALFMSANAVYHSRVGLFQKESQENFKIIKLLEGKNDLDSRLLYANILMAIADNYTEKSNFKLAHQFANKSLNLIERIPEKEYMQSRKILRRKSSLYYHNSIIYLQEYKPDEAIHYIEKSYNQVLKEKNRYIALPLECYGDYFMQKKDYDNAVLYYKRSIENKQQFYQRTFPVDSKIAEAYFKIGKVDSANFHLVKSEKYRTLDLKSKNLDSSNAERFLYEEEKEIVQRDYKRYGFLVLILISVLFVIILFLYNYLQRLKINKSRSISEKQNIIQEKQNEINGLNSKLNESFEEVIKLAKENSPYFWIRFQEVYPDYCRKILILNPNLRDSELTLSAYIYLGFTSKEIAAYTFKALKTIENNRHNFRKKINLPQDKDLAVSIRKYLM